MGRINRENARLVTFVAVLGDVGTPGRPGSPDELLAWARECPGVPHAVRMCVEPLPGVGGAGFTWKVSGEGDDLLEQHNIDARAAQRCAEERARIVEFIRSTPDHTTRILARLADEIESGLHEEMTGPLHGRAERARAAALARKAGEP